MCSTRLACFGEYWRILQISFAHPAVAILTCPALLSPRGAGEGEDCWPNDLPEPPMHSRSMRLNGISDSFKRGSFNRGSGDDGNPGSTSNPME